MGCLVRRQAHGGAVHPGASSHWQEDASVCKTLQFINVIPVAFVRFFLARAEGWSDSSILDFLDRITWFPIVTVRHGHLSTSGRFFRLLNAVVQFLDMYIRKGCATFWVETLLFLITFHCPQSPRYSQKKTHTAYCSWRFWAAQKPNVPLSLTIDPVVLVRASMATHLLPSTPLPRCLVCDVFHHYSRLYHEQAPQGHHVHAALPGLDDEAR